MSAVENIIVDALNSLTRHKRHLKSNELSLGRGDDAPVFKLAAGAHVHVLGATRCGKSKAVEFILRELTRMRRNWLLLDVHGDSASAMISYLHQLPDEETRGRVIYIDFSQQKYLPILNPLSTNGHAEPSAIVGLNMESLRQRWGDGFGPRVEQMLSNTLWLLVENNLTLLEIHPLLTDPIFRHGLLAQSRNGEVKRFWSFFDALSAGMQSAFVEPVLSRFNSWLINPLVRNVIGQAKSTIPFRAVLDRKGMIFICNFGKGLVQSENALFLASIVLPPLVGAIFSRADMSLEKRTPFALVIDEAQALLGSENLISSLIEESSKYGTQLILIHQSLSQFGPAIRSSLMGNVSQMCVFRVSPADASEIAPAVAPGREKAVKAKLVELPQRHMLFCDRNSGRMCFAKTPFVEDYPMPSFERNRFMHENIQAGILRPVSEIEREIAQRSAIRREHAPVMALPYEEGQSGF